MTGERVRRDPPSDWDVEEGDRPGAERPEVFLIRHRDSIRFLRFEEIDWVSAEGNYSSIHCGRTHYLVRRGIGDLADRLEQARFLRINRSAVVNLDRVECLVPWFNGGYQVRLVTGIDLRLTNGYASRLFQRVGRPL
ncbi:MAG: LytTR family DNA-binding domain-containing protein [Gemmatimonadota bacterium]